jgi:hypothetical protein
MGEVVVGKKKVAKRSLVESVTRIGLFEPERFVPHTRPLKTKNAVNH